MGPGLLFCPYLVPVPRLSVSVRGRRRARVWPVPMGPAGLLAPRLLLGSTLASLIPLRRTDSTLAGVAPTLVVWSGSVSEKSSTEKSVWTLVVQQPFAFNDKICVITPPGAAV